MSDRAPYLLTQLNFLVLFAIVGLGWLVNLILRRPMLNGWYLGIIVVIALSSFNAWQFTLKGFFDSPNAFEQGEVFGELVTGPALFPALLAIWRGRKFSTKRLEWRLRRSRTDEG